MYYLYSLYFLYHYLDYETDEKGLSMEAVFMVLTSLNILPKSLYFVLESYLDEQQLWDHLYNLPGKTTVIDNTIIILWYSFLKRHYFLAVKENQVQ